MIGNDKYTNLAYRGSSTRRAIRFYDYKGRAEKFYIDNIRVRKYVDPEPEAKPETIEKCRTDFGDIRFTDCGGVTELSYWIEEKVDGDYAVFWVKVPFIPASPETTTIYIYYGNPDATSISNGDATFIFFDHFEGTSLDTTKWRTDITGSGTISVSDSCVWFTTGTTNRSRTHIVSVISFNLINFLIEARFMALQQGTHFDDRIFQEHYFGPGSNGLHISHRGAPGDERVNVYISGTWQTEQIIYSDPPLNVWLRHRTIVYGSYSKLMLLNDALNVLGSKTYSGFAPTITGLGPIGAVNLGSTSNLRSKLDWYFVRNFVDPEPSHGAWGTEEVAITLTETSILTDLIFKSISTIKTDALSLFDSVSKTPSIPMAESISLTDVTVKSTSLMKSEALTLSDVYSRTWTTYRVYSESLSLVDTVTALKVLIQILTEILALSDVITKTASAVKLETVTLKDLYSRIWSTYRTYSEALGLADYVVKTPSIPKTESLGLIDTIAKVVSISRTYSEVLGLADYVSKGMVLHEFSEAISLADSLRYGVNITVLAKLIRKLIQLEDIGGEWLEQFR